MYQFATYLDTAITEIMNKSATSFYLTITEHIDQSEIYLDTTITEKMNML